MNFKVDFTGPGVLSHVEDLKRRCAFAAKDWETPSPTGLMTETLSARESERWRKLEAIFEEAGEKILKAVRDEIHEESCGA